MQLNLFLQKDAKEERVTHSTSNKIKFTPFSKASKVVDETFKSLCSKHQANLETSMRGNDFIYLLIYLFICLFIYSFVCLFVYLFIHFNLVLLMYYKYHWANFICGSSYNESPNCIKMKKTTIIPKNAENKCFQYAATVALNYITLRKSFQY